MGADVFGYSLAPETQPNLHNLIADSSRGSSRICDIRDIGGLRGAIEAAKPTIAIHLAAQSLVLRSYAVPVETFATNVMGTVNLLEALRGQIGLNAVLVVTTDKVYENAEARKPFREDDSLGGHDPYSASKAAAEIVTSSFARSFYLSQSVPVLTARAGNVIGGGDWAPDRIVPDVVRACQAGLPVILRKPQSIRPWEHVLEPLCGYMMYLERAVEGASVPSSLNFGPDAQDTITVVKLVEEMLSALEAVHGWRLADTGDDLVEMSFLALDPSLAKRSLGWRTRLSSREAIDWTAEWYRRWAKGESAKSLCLDQISRYEVLL
jgi:CDP-glucose 4,6-dehydratase